MASTRKGFAAMPQRAATKLPSVRGRLDLERHAVELAEDEVDTSSEQSFPASDPPSWSSFTRIGSPQDL
jgi:hypothetical protein